MPYDDTSTFTSDQSAPPEAAGVAYTTNDYAPDLRMFRCERYRATVSTKTCASRWLKAQDAIGSVGAALESCGTCSIGACHAGRGLVHYSPWYRSGICPRCGNGGRRTIGGRVCISCYNRARELRLGRNARGHAPVELMKRPLHRVEIRVSVDGNSRRLVDRESSGTVETMVHFLRNNTGEVVFGWAGRGPSGDTAQRGSADRRAGHGHAASVDAARGWFLTDRRCQSCGGTVLRSADGPVAHRCADCGRPGEGEEEHDARSAGAASRTSRGGHLATPHDRLAVFATTAVSLALKHGSVWHAKAPPPRPSLTPTRAASPLGRVGHMTSCAPSSTSWPRRRR